MCSRPRPRALEHGTGVGYDARVGGVITQEPSDGTAIVVFQVEAPSEEDGWREALDAYTKLRANAKLDPAPPLGGTVTILRWPEPTPPPAPPPPVVVPTHERLLARARELRKDGEHNHAIVLAQTACEVRIAEGMRRLIAHQVPGLLKPLEQLLSKRFALTDHRVAEVWRGLTGNHVREASFWQRYAEHVARRNGIVHEGSDASDADAESSIEAAEQMCAYVAEHAP